MTGPPENLGVEGKELDFLEADFRNRNPYIMLSPVLILLHRLVNPVVTAALDVVESI